MNDKVRKQNRKRLRQPLASITFLEFVADLFKVELTAAPATGPTKPRKNTKVRREVRHPNQ
jgi:hypothetical protein